MARTNVPISAFVPNGSLANPAGTAGDSANGHNIVPSKTERLIIRVVNGGGGSINAIVRAGVAPPALEAGQGDLTVAVGAGATSYIGPFTSGRFAQKDGSVNLDLSGATSVTVTAFQDVPAG